MAQIQTNKTAMRKARLACVLLCLRLIEKVVSISLASISFEMCRVKFAYVVYYLIKIVDLDKMPNVFKHDQTHAKFPVCLGSIKKASCTLTFGWQGKIPEVTLPFPIPNGIYQNIPWYTILYSKFYQNLTI